MKVTADTNLLVRLLTKDDPRQTRLAEEALAQAELIAVTVMALCELVWVLSRRYRIDKPSIASAIRNLIEVQNVVVDRPPVEAGLAMLDAGGDLADGAIAHQGAWLGGEVFVSFDKQAVRRIEASGEVARLLS